MKLTPVGIDIAKTVFQLHYVDAETGEIVNKPIKRAAFLAHFANREPMTKEELAEFDELALHSSEREVAAAEAERSTAGNRTAQVSTELAGKLRHAADKYDETDLAEMGKLDNQMPPR